jgi:hypothetical protein
VKSIKEIILKIEQWKAEPGASKGQPEGLLEQGSWGVGGRRVGASFKASPTVRQTIIINNITN